MRGFAANEIRYHRRLANTIPDTKYARSGVNIIYIEHTGTKNYDAKKAPDKTVLRTMNTANVQRIAIFDKYHERCCHMLATFLISPYNCRAQICM